MNFLVIYTCLVFFIQKIKTENELAFWEDMTDLENSDNIKFFGGENILCEVFEEKYKTLLGSVDNYIKRYISLFLITSNLMDYEIKSLNDEIIFDLEINILGKDLIYLQEYIKNDSNTENLKNLSKLDSILTKIAKVKEKSFQKVKINYLLNYIYNIDFLKWAKHPNLAPFWPLIITIIVSLYLNYLYFKSFFTFIFMLFNILVLWEGINLYRKRLKEASISLYVETMKHKNFPAECEPENVWWYNSVKNYFLGDPCLQYYQTINRVSEEEVSIVNSIIDSYAFYFVETPFRVFGTSVKNYSKEISDFGFFPFNYLIYCTNLGTIPILICVIILIYCGKRLTLSFFGTSLSIGNSATPKAKKNLEKIPNKHSQRPKTVLERKSSGYRLIKRSPRRLDINFIKRMKKLQCSSLTLLQDSVSENENNNAT